MVTFHTTKPREKMPDEMELSSDYRVYLKMDFDLVYHKWGSEYVGDLTKYYEWIEFQDIRKMEHSLMRYGNQDMNKSVNAIIMFTFPTIGDAVAFKLAWK